MVPSFRLPFDYIERKEVVFFEDICFAATNIIHQPEVYDAADYFITATGRSTIIDIGCGSGRKLQTVRAERRIGIDFGSNIAWCRSQHGGNGDWIEADLSKEGCIALAELAGEHVVVVCADVVEHLLDPRPLLALLAACHERGAIVITSTPDRVRVRGQDDKGPPCNPSHIREWALDEYVALLADACLPPVYAGYTLNNNINRELKSIVTVHDIAIARARLSAPAGQRPVAILAAYNEVDVIEEVVQDLLAQDCDIVAIDNWSNDGTWEILEAAASGAPARVRVERFPSHPSPHYDWQKILRRKEAIASEFPGRWILHMDADEIRRSPFPGTTMAEAFAIAERTGANRVNFNMVNFRPVTEAPYSPGSLGTHFAYFEYGLRPGHFQQNKAWLQGAARVDLASTGGHLANFPGARDFRYKFFLQHYPIRSHSHGQKKIILDRQGRWSPYERNTLGWHVQYDAFSADSIYVWDKAVLHRFDSLFWQEHGLLILTDILQRRLANRPKPPAETSAPGN